MQHVEDIKAIRGQLTTVTKGFDKIMSSNYIMFWFDPKDKVFVGYDTKTPENCYNSVATKHTDYEFVGMKSMPSGNSAVEIIKALRLVNEITPDLQQMHQISRISRELKSA
jgi:hypothetical protein